MKKLSLMLLLAVPVACRQNPVARNSNATVTTMDNSGTPQNFKWVFYDYGEPLPVGLAEARNAVLAKYEVQTANLGCVVTNRLLRDIKLHNDSLFVLLQPKYPGLNADRINQEIADYENLNKKK